MESSIGGGAQFLDGEWEFTCELFTSEQEDTYFASSFFNPHHHHNADEIPYFFTSQYGSTDSSASTFDNVHEAAQPTCFSSYHILRASSSSDNTTTAMPTPPQPDFCLHSDQYSSMQPFMDFLSMETYREDDGLFFTSSLVSDHGANVNETATPMAEVGSSSQLMMETADDFELVQARQAAPTPKKRTRASKDVNGQKEKRKVRAKKNKEPLLSVEEEEETGNVGSTNDGQSSSSDMVLFDSESNVAATVLEGSGGPETAVTFNRKKIRASRGAATDAQSLYARKRRERINERLRILQNLVPNGTKVVKKN